MDDPRARPRNWQVEQPAGTASRTPETGPDSLPSRVRSPRRPGPSGTAAHGNAILSDHDMAVIRKAVARARLDGTDPGPDPPAPESRETRPPASSGSAPPPAATPALPAADPFWGTPQPDTIQKTPTRHRSRPTSSRWRLTGAIILAAILFGGGALTVTLVHRSAAGSGPVSGGPPPGEAAIAGAAAARTAAAAWVARQVDPAAIIACDPQMCAVLQGDGIPAGRLLLLGAGNAGPLGSNVIMSTAAVREEFGGRLTSVYAPVALAAFGSGSAQVSVRVVAADGSAAYQRSLQADASARRSAGAQLLRNPDVRASPVGRRALAAGQVDARLLNVIVALAARYRLDIAGFGAPTAGASPAIPLRSANILVAAAGGGPVAATLNAAKRFLLSQQSPFRPAHVTTVQLAGGQAALHVEFTAPSPLGLVAAPN